MKRSHGGGPLSAAVSHLTKCKPLSEQDNTFFDFGGHGPELTTWRAIVLNG